LTAALNPTVPPPPGRFSTITCPMVDESLSPISRAMM
jgi:hypothetical protein